MTEQPPAQSREAELKLLQKLSLRLLCFFAEALARLELLLLRNGHRFNSHESRIAVAIKNDLAELQTSVYRQVRLLKAPTKAHSIITQVINEYASLGTLHKQLRHLSVLSILPESIDFINRAWAALSRVGNLQRPPALCLSDSMSPSEHAYSGVSVVALSKVDLGNSLAWPLLLHELAHKAIQDLQFDSPISTLSPMSHRLQQSWLIELGCDFIGLQLAGPAYLAPFVLSALTEAPFYTGTSRHPAPVHRVATLMAECSGWAGDPLLSELAALFEARKVHSSAAYSGIESLDGSKVVCCHCQHELSHIFAIPDPAPPPLKEFLAQLNEKLPIPRYDSDRLRMADPIARQLGEGILGGSSHDLPAAKRAYDDFAAVSGASPSDRSLQAFSRAKSSICDTPNDIFDIVTAGWMNYFASSEARLDATVAHATSPQEFALQWKLFRERVAADDELLRASIESAEFHEKTKALRGDDA